MSESEAGIRMLGAAGGPLSDDEILASYAVADPGTPQLRVNFVASVDGAATHDGLSGGLGTPADKRVFELLRYLADVIIVGAGTVRAEGYGGLRLDADAEAWRSANGLPAQPEFAIISGSLELDPASEVFTKAARRPIVLTSESAPPDRRAALAEVAEVIDCGAASVETPLLKRMLAERGLTQQHSEGGPHLMGAMIAEGALDELCLTVSPRLEGGTARRISDDQLASPTDLRLLHALAAEDGTLLLRYAVA